MPPHGNLFSAKRRKRFSKLSHISRNPLLLRLLTITFEAGIKIALQITEKPNNGKLLTLQRTC